MPYRRRVLRYGPGPAELQNELSDRVIAGCWFELLRQGGCGRGELTLKDDFVDREALQVGEWIACEFDDGDRWYLGRIEQRRALWPGGITLHLVGMSAQLDEVFPGGFGLGADGQRPHRYSQTDRFYNDPDYGRETVDVIDRPEELVRLLLEQYVVPATDIQQVPELIENAETVADVVSLKFHGEDAVRSIVRDLALRVQSAAWGVDEQGQFFFLPQRTTPAATYQIGAAMLRLLEIQDRTRLFNRVLLTGGYEYGNLFDSGADSARRWRGNYRQPTSIGLYGERRIRLNVPWIRTPEDSRQFVREFFRLYAAPATRYQVQVRAAGVCPRPWLGPVRLLDREGAELIQAAVEVIRVQFDHEPLLQMELGPLDPRELWPPVLDDDYYPVGYHDGSSGSGGDEVEVSSSGGASESDGVTEADCPMCEEVPVQWQVTFSGVENGDCDECELLNDTFVLDFDPEAAGCVWVAGHAACAAESEGRIEFAMSETHLSLMIWVGGLITQYQKVWPYDCLEANTLNFLGSADECTNWPATVVVEPVP